MHKILTNAIDNKKLSRPVSKESGVTSPYLRKMHSITMEAEAVQISK